MNLVSQIEQSFAKEIRWSVQVLEILSTNDEQASLGLRKGRMVQLMCSLLDTINNISGENSEIFAQILHKLTKTLAQVMHKSEAKTQFTLALNKNIKSLVALMERNWYGTQR